MIAAHGRVPADEQADRHNLLVNFKAVRGLARLNAAGATVARLDTRAEAYRIQLDNRAATFWNSPRHAWRAGARRGAGISSLIEHLLGGGA